MTDRKKQEEERRRRDNVNRSTSPSSYNNATHVATTPSYDSTVSDYTPPADSGTASVSCDI